MVGKIENVPLREIWKHEAYNFTTWLEENMDSLESVLGFRLSAAEREHKTENFSVDILAEDESGKIVIIENQLEKSNHDHLGKLITYLSAVGADCAIWIVSEPRSEHVKAVAWLNESASTDFYLIKIEAIKIGDSLPAPLFTVIVGPSEEAREVGEAKKEMKERHVLRKQFWTTLLEQAKDKTTLHSNITPGIYSWIGTGAGKSGLSFNYVISRNEARVELYIDRGKESHEENQRIFEEIFEKKSEIQNTFGYELSWERMENKRAFRIAKYVKIGGYANEEKWADIIEELISNMVKLETALKTHINSLTVV